MDQRGLYIKAMCYQKTGVDVFFNIFSAVQRGGQTMVARAVEQSSWVPSFGKKSCVFWLDECSKGTGIVKAFVEEGYSGAEQFWTNKGTKATAYAAGGSLVKTTNTKDADTPSPVSAVKNQTKAAKPATSKAVGGKTTTSKKKSSATKSSPRKRASGKAGTAKSASGKKTATGKAAESMTTAQSAAVTVQAKSDSSGVSATSQEQTSPLKADSPEKSSV